MALVVNSSPAAKSSANGPVIFTVYESIKAIDPIAYPGYQYVADLYIDGAFVTRLQAFPHPVHKRGVFDFGPSLRTFLTPEFHPIAAGGIVPMAADNGEFYKDFQVKFGEEYNYTTTTNLLVDPVRRIYNHYNLTPADNLLPAFSDKWLTRRPRQRVLRTGRFFLPFYRTGGAGNVTVTAYNAAGAPTGSISPFITPASTDSVWMADLSPETINATSPGLITDATAYFTASIGGEVIRLDFDCEAIHTPRTVTFLNQLGGWESFTFTKASKKTWDGERKSITRQAYSVNSDGLVSFATAGGVLPEIRSTYNVNQRPRLRVTSDLLTDAEWTWLRELVFSPAVFLHDGAFFQPVTITATNYEEKHFTTDKLQPLSLELDYGVTIQSQNR